MSAEEANEKISEFMSAIHIEPNGKYSDLTAYMPEEKTEPFILPISSSANINIDTLKFRLYDLLEK
jgi:hypothetical protein